MRRLSSLPDLRTRSGKLILSQSRAIGRACLPLREIGVVFHDKRPTSPSPYPKIPFLRQQPLTWGCFISPGSNKEAWFAKAARLCMASRNKRMPQGALFPVVEHF